MTAHRTRFTIPLGDAADLGVDEVGRKAHTLSVLTRAGFPVPDGVVLPLGSTKDLDDGEIRAMLGAVFEQLGRPVAVRSSALAEDTVDRSFAGQYETVLSVDDFDALRSAVNKVRASGATERVRAYGDGDSDVAVLIQRMVPADAAGVAFTADPVTGDRNVTLVSSVSGLGERLVSGEADPDEWEVRNGNVIARRTPEFSLEAEAVKRVAALAQKVTEHLGGPQDVEWALAGDDLYLLQSRPITGLPEVEPLQPAVEIPEEGFWVLDGGHYPTPISPMAASFYLPALEQGATEAFRDWGLLLERLENRVIGGRVYARIVPAGGKEGPAPPWWLLGILARIVPPIRRQVKKAQRAFDTGRMESVIDRWWKEWRPQFEREIDELHSVEIADLEDAALLDHLDRAIDLLARGERVHFELFPPYMVAVAEMVKFCEEHLGWSNAKATELLSGLSTMSTEPARRLGELAELARSRPAIRHLLDSGEPVTLDEFRDADDTFAAALDRYLAEFGARATAYDVLAPTLEESEELVITAIRSEAGYEADAVAERHDEARERLLDEARSELAGDEAALSHFETLLDRVRRAYPVREDNVFFTDNAPLGLVRLAALEIGRRLVGRGLLDDAGHVFFLTIEEARESLRSGTDYRERVQRRRAEREWALRHTPKPSYGEDPGPPPDLRALPEPVRRLMEAVAFFMENDLAAATGDGLVGTPASAGTYTGTARVILSEQDFDRVRPGDVLVCPITTPAWSVLFGRIGALVTDTGGMLSHSAIVAREHAVPAVVATGYATTEIPDGRIVTVDGNTGHIEVKD